ncbi:mRNA splicing protein, partial [Coemansia sp. RSA 2322]
MSSISQFLPEPKHAGGRQQEPIEAAELVVVVAAAASDSTDSKIPAYGHRVGWVPKTASDFGDGGAYPEIHVLQFPLGMGRKQGKKGNALAKQVDKEGNVSYDALARFGRRENETVHSQFKDMVPLRQRKDFGDEESAIPQRPSEEEVREAAERTKLALDKISSGKANGSKGAVNGIGRTEPTFVRYTASSGTGQRIVRVSDMPVDPMEPPKVRHQKKARAPGSPPAPVMHSPPRKITADEQKEWSIPPCVSNWKNIHGFTVSLDKRLATDGRGMEELSVSDNFARLSEALGSAEALARREIQERAQIQQTLARREKEANEERLRLLAQRAREERATASATTTAGYVPPPAIAAASEAVQEQSKKSPVAGARGHEPGRRTAADFFSGKASPSATPSLQRARDEDEEERDAMRRERHKERERAMRATRMGAEGKAKYLRSSENRDISEKIALGLAKPTAAGREG